MHILQRFFQKNLHISKISSTFATVSQIPDNRDASKRTPAFRKVPHLGCSFGLPPMGNEIITIKN